MSRPLQYAIIAIALFIIAGGMFLFLVIYVGLENPGQSYNWIFTFGLGLIALSLCFGLLALFSSMQPKSDSNLETEKIRKSNPYGIISGIILSLAGAPFLLLAYSVEQHCKSNTSCPSYSPFLDIGLVLLVVGILVLIPSFGSRETLQPKSNIKKMNLFCLRNES